MDPNLAANPYFQLGVVGASFTFSLSLVGLFIRHLNARDNAYRSERNEMAKGVHGELVLDLTCGMGERIPSDRGGVPHKPTAGRD